MRIIITITSLFCALTTMAVSGTLISQWERSHDYPFGQMCNSVFTGYVNTCRSASN